MADDCEPCTEAAAISVANMICKDLKEIDVDCKELFDDVVQGRRSVAEYLSRVMDVTRGTKLEESMDEVMKIYQQKARG